MAVSNTKENGTFCKMKIYVDLSNNNNNNLNPNPNLNLS